MIIGGNTSVFSSSIINYCSESNIFSSLVMLPRPCSLQECTIANSVQSSSYTLLSLIYSSCHTKVSIAIVLEPIPDTFLMEYFFCTKFTSLQQLGKAACFLITFVLLAISLAFFSSSCILQPYSCCFCQLFFSLFCS